MLGFEFETYVQQYFILYKLIEPESRLNLCQGFEHFVKVQSGMTLEIDLLTILRNLVTKISVDPQNF